MGRISAEQSRREVEALTQRAHTARADGDLEVALAAYRTLLNHPCAAHRADLDDARRAVALLAVQQVGAGDLDGSADDAPAGTPLDEPGRRGEADTRYARLRARDPDNVAVYASAGEAYSGVDDEMALEWVLDGIDVALTTGDRNHLLTDLLDQARDLWDRLGESPDLELLALVETFQRNRLDTHRPRRGPCAHCGADSRTT